MNAKTATGFVVMSALTLTAAAGCSAEVPTTSDDVAVSTAEEFVTAESTTVGDCTGVTPATRQKATQLVRYVFGNDSLAPSGGAACNNLKTALLQLRTAINDGSFLVSDPGTTTWCGVTTYHDYVQRTGSTDVNLMPNIVDAIAKNLDACKGNGVLGAFIPYSQGSAFFMDPEPATVTANLSATTGATAAAYYALSNTSTSVVYRSGAAAACGTLKGGESCSTSALAMGSTTKQMIQKTGAICTCR